MARSRMAWGGVGLAVFLLAGCNVIQEELAETPTEPEPVSTVSPISIPVILPASNPTPQPNPAPTPTPTPEPNPAPPPSGGGGCGAPASNPSNPVCGMLPPLFLDNVEEAIDRVTEKYPNLFNFNNRKCGDCYKVKDVDTYIARVQDELGKMGLCTLWDGEEVAVKKTNDRSEQYDIILASNHIRRGDGSYRGNCDPSWF